MFTKDQRVMTSRGAGSVAYQRMAPPDYATPEAVSVVLDSERYRNGYAGTIFSAADVAPEATTPARALTCDMTNDCHEPITHIDEKGYIYCRAHGIQRKTCCRCRQLQPAELNRLKRGEALQRY